MSENPVFLLDIDKVNRAVEKAAREAMMGEVKAQFAAQIPDVDLNLNQTFNFPGVANFKIDLPGIDVVVITDGD